MSYYEHSKYRGVDGVVIACINFSDPSVAELIHGELPVVTIDHVFDNRTAIISDNIKGMHDLITYIYELGHRKIAFIHGADSSVTRNRIGSYYRTLGELGIAVSDEYVKNGVYHDADVTANPSNGFDATDFVLSVFPKRELEVLNQLVDRTIDYVTPFIGKDLEIPAHTLDVKIDSL
jgi:DNA-binding LacI/PurR family transcriptional regulator